MAAALFGEMVKAVVDVEKVIVAVDAELHADLEALLLQNGSQ
jgi:multisubunit Na+/H+ antiporter MnhE subunit